MGIEERKKREKEERRNQIIKTARKEFIHSGLRHASIKEIARKAELSPRTIYTYFNNKQELYGAVLLNGLRILRRKIAKIASREDDPANALELVKKAYANFYKTNREYFRIMIFIGFHDIHEEVGAAICHEISDEVVGCISAVSEIIEKGKRRGVLNGGDPKKLSWLLWSLFIGIGHLNEARSSLDAGRKDFESLFDFAYRTMMSNGNNEPAGRSRERRVSSLAKFFCEA
jgi:AcrR family transcriptional regulator